MKRRTLDAVLSASGAVVAAVATWALGILMMILAVLGCRHYRETEGSATVGV